MVTKTINACLYIKTLEIGRQLENNYRQIIFDCSGFGEDIAGITLVHQRSKDEAPYIVTTSDSATLTWNISDTDTAPELFPMWTPKPPMEYKKGDRVQSLGILYRCLQSHTSQADWTPSTATSLWVRVDDPSVEFPEWRQPQGSHDAYNKGDKVSHNGKHWQSDVDGNVWEPGVYGWSEV